MELKLVWVNFINPSIRHISMTDFCYFLNQKQETIEGKNPRHTCRLKDIRIDGDDICIATKYLPEGETSTSEYNEDDAQECPCFTTDRAQAKLLQKEYQRIFGK